jgi:hypothetical protein
MITQSSAKGFALLDKYDLNFEAWCHHKEIPMVVWLAEAFPNIAISFFEGETNSKGVQSYEEVIGHG